MTQRNILPGTQASAAIKTPASDWQLRKAPDGAGWWFRAACGHHDFRAGEEPPSYCRECRRLELAARQAATRKAMGRRR